MSRRTPRFARSCLVSRAAGAVLALAAVATVPAVSFAGDRGERYERKRDADESRREREDDRRDDHRRDEDRRRESAFRVDVNIRGGSWERVPPTPRVYEQRVWVEP